MMKKLTIILVLSITTFGFSQKVTVNKKGEKIKGETAEGFYTDLEGKKEAVATAWGKFLKDLGKIKSGIGYQFIETPALGGTLYSTGIIYFTTSGNQETASVWMGIKAAEWTVNDIKLVENQLEKLVYQFGVKYYRDKIQAQIDEGKQALDAVVRQQQRLTTQNLDLTIKLGNNEQEKILLEQSIENNKLEHLVVLQKIVNNKKSQDSVAMTGEKIKKVIEMHKERQRKVN